MSGINTNRQKIKCCWNYLFYLIITPEWEHSSMSIGLENHHIQFSIVHRITLGKNSVHYAIQGLKQSIDTPFLSMLKIWMSLTTKFCVNSEENKKENLKAVHVSHIVTPQHSSHKNNATTGNFHFPRSTRTNHNCHIHSPPAGGTLVLGVCRLSYECGNAVAFCDIFLLFSGLTSVSDEIRVPRFVYSLMCRWINGVVLKHISMQIMLIRAVMFFVLSLAEMYHAKQ